MTGTTPVEALTTAEKQTLLRELLQRRERRDELGPLSYSQQAMWFLHHIDPGNAAYNVALAFTVRGELDHPALEWSLGRLAERHPVLRTSYREYGGVPVQQVHPDRGLPLSVVDATGWPEAQFDTHLIAESVRPFDLAGDPVLRVTSFHRPGGRCVLLLVGHHIALDGWSFYLCLEELGELYTARRGGRTADLPPVRATYADHVRRQRDLLRGPRGEQLGGYWRERMAGELAPLELPTDRPRPPTQTFHGARHPFLLDRELTAGLRELARSEGTTLFAVLLAGLQVALFRYTGQTDVRVASPVAHREQAGCERVVGYFADAVVLRTDLAGAPTFRILLGRSTDTVLGALEHQDLPFSALVEMLQGDRDPSRGPLCDVSFVLQQSHRFAFTRDDQVGGSGDGGTSPFGLRSAGESGLRLVLGDLVLQSYPLEQPVARYDLELQAMEADGAVSAVLTYNTDLFDRETVAAFAAHLVELWRAAAADPDQPVARLRILPAATRQRLLEWGGVATGADEAGPW